MRAVRAGSASQSGVGYGACPDGQTDGEDVPAQTDEAGRAVLSPSTPEVCCQRLWSPHTGADAPTCWDQDGDSAGQSKPEAGIEARTTPSSSILLDNPRRGDAGGCLIFDRSLGYRLGQWVIGWDV